MYVFPCGPSSSCARLQQLFSLCSDNLTKGKSGSPLLLRGSYSRPSRGAESHTNLYSTAGVFTVTDTLFSLRYNTEIFMPVYLFLPALILRLCFFFFYYFSLFLLTRTPQVRPDSPSVQRQGTGSRHWLDFHTIPSSERHIKLIRVNKCGGALLSGTAISLAQPGSAIQMGW